MKVYISVDIEGITGVTSWDETELNHPDHKAAALQMTREMLAACEGAIAAGATEILIKDAHDSARNMDITCLLYTSSIGADPIVLPEDYKSANAKEEKVSW